MAKSENLLIDGRWQAAREPRWVFRAEDPTCGQEIEPAFPVCGDGDIERALHAASTAAPALAAVPPAAIAAFLDDCADRIDADRDALIALAHTETALPADTRLPGELARTTGQLRQAARAVREHAWTHPVIDTHAGLRAHYAPLAKPVLVFGPNNFPFAFNAISGSDFASAMAARNPVIAKAHPSHPATSQRLAQCVFAALEASVLPLASVQMLYHFDNDSGLWLAADPRLGAIAFTGSRHGGLALKAAADGAGIPMYAEMSSVNPVFLLPEALAQHGKALAAELFASCTMGSGQFCTNPGVVIVPAGAGGDAFSAEAQRLYATAAPNVLFSRSVRDNLVRALAQLRQAGAVVLAGGAATSGPGYYHAPTLLQVSGSHFLAHAEQLQGEAFGPSTLLIQADNVAQMVRIAAAFEGNLTGTLYRAEDGADEAAFQQIASVLRPRVGRLIANKMPTGVAVSPAMNHGGPYPSTSHSGFTAVGMPGAIRRFAALQCYDNVPEHLLPADLRDHNLPGLQRCVDGHWTDRDIDAGVEA